MKKSILLISITIYCFNLYSQVFSPLSSGTSNHITAVHFVDDNIGYFASYNGTIKKTTNAGASFITQNSGVFTIINDIDFINKDTGFAVVDNGTILRTYNGGTSWNSAYSGAISKIRISFNGNIVFCTTDDGKILKSTNFGNSWSIISNTGTGTSARIYDIFWTSPSVGYFVEWGYVRKTINGGYTFKN